MNKITTSVKKYLNWKDWLIGMYTKSIRSATSAALAFVGTNSIEALSPKELSGLGLNIKQAAAAFMSVLIIEIFRYINKKPLPNCRITVTEETPK